VSESAESVIRLSTNLSASVDAATLTALHRKRWCIESGFQRLEAVPHSAIRSLGYPRAALPRFTVAMLADNVLSLLQRVLEHAHRNEHPQREVSTYHLAEHVRSGYEGMLIALPVEPWSRMTNESPSALAQR